MADTVDVQTEEQESPLDFIARGGLLEGGVVPDPTQVDMDRFNLIHPELWRQEKYWDYFRWLRENSPVHYTKESMFGPYWSITRYDDIVSIDTNHKQFSSDSKFGGITLVDQDEDFQLPMFIAMDEPKHSEQRKTVQPIVAPPALRDFEELIRERTIRTLDSLPVGEPFDWVDRVSIELTGMMLATLFGFPQEERRKLTRWSDVATGRFNKEICPGGEEQWRTELLECLGRFNEIWQERAQSEEPGQDLISMLAHGEKTQNMDQMEYLGNLILLIVGGNDTSRNTMTGSIYGWNKFPKEYEKVTADPSRIPDMVSEVIRWQTPLAYMRRTALEDVEFQGKTIKKGDKVVMWYASGNRDESVIENPNAIWIDRPNVRRHLSFGFGIHRCVGNRLAEQQLRILWEELLKRYEFVQVLEEPERLPNAFVKGYHRMNVVLHPKK